MISVRGYYTPLYIYMEWSVSLWMYGYVTCVLSSVFVLNTKSPLHCKKGKKHISTTLRRKLHNTYRVHAHSSRPKVKRYKIIYSSLCVQWLAQNYCVRPTKNKVSHFHWRNRCCCRSRRRSSTAYIFLVNYYIFVFYVSLRMNWGFVIHLNWLPDRIGGERVLMNEFHFPCWIKDIYLWRG